MNPQLAEDWQRARLVEYFKRKGAYVIAQPKLDGCRGGQYSPGAFTGRSLKPYKNKKLTKFWSNIVFDGLDGELILPPPYEWNFHAMCRMTTSVVNTIDSPTIPNLVAFDFVTPKSAEWAYLRRYEKLQRWVEKLREEETRRIHLMPMRIAKSIEELEGFDDEWVTYGYEGTIVRNPDAPFKPDRSTLAMELWRIKRRLDFEFVVDEVVEAMENQNEAKTNALGRTERSTHKANKVGKGMVGAIKGRVLKKVLWQGKVLFEKDQPIKVGPGEMTHADRVKYWKRQDRIVGKIGKAKVQPHGTMEKPRAPVWIGFRAAEDMS